MSGYANYRQGPMRALLFAAAMTSLLSPVSAQQSSTTTIPLDCTPRQSLPGATAGLVVINQRGPTVPKGTVVTIRYVVQTPAPINAPPGKAASSTLVWKMTTWITPVQMPVAYAVGTGIPGWYCINATYQRPTELDPSLTQ